MKKFFNVLFFLFCCEIKRKKRTKRKRKHAIISYALTSVVQMDVAGKPALSRSLKNARDVVFVSFVKIYLVQNCRVQFFAPLT